MSRIKDIDHEAQLHHYAKNQKDFPQVVLTQIAALKILDFFVGNFIETIIIMTQFCHSVQFVFIIKKLHFSAAILLQI